MITIHHNFDEKKFKWLWAKYVKAGNIEKHCTACLIGPYSKKFSGSSNHNLLEQSTLIMDEVPEDQFDAIYFCGVIKKGYLNKNPLKNNYPHNVHFAIRPQKGAHDVWVFENWHVKIDDGVLEAIPTEGMLRYRFFSPPYNAHFYTCRIFRWMVGHFYPQELKYIDFTKIMRSLFAQPKNIFELKRESLGISIYNAGRDYAISCLTTNYDGCEKLIDGRINPNQIAWGDAVWEILGWCLDDYISLDESLFSNFKMTRDNLDELIDELDLRQKEDELFSNGMYDYIDEVYGNDWETRYPIKRDPS